MKIVVGIIDQMERNGKAKTPDEKFLTTVAEIIDDYLMSDDFNNEIVKGRGIL